MTDKRMLSSLRKFQEMLSGSVEMANPMTIPSNEIVTRDDILKLIKLHEAVAWVLRSIAEFPEANTLTPQEWSKVLFLAQMSIEDEKDGD